MLDRTAPHDIESEQQVLGSMLLVDGGLEAIATVRTILEKSDFYKETHQKIYMAILECADSGIPIYDFHSETYQKIYKKYENTPQSEYANREYLEFLFTTIVTAVSAEYYAKRVKECAVLREIIDVSHSTGEKAFTAFEQNIISTDLINDLQDMLTQNKTIASVGGTIPSIFNDWGKVFTEIYNPTGKEFLGLRTGFEKLDRSTLGLRGLSVVGGIPGQGKSSIALQMGCEIARLEGVPVLFYALEMSKWDLYFKAISRLSKLDYVTLKIGSLINGKRGLGLSENDLDKLNKATTEFMQFADRIKIIDRSVCKDISLAYVKLHIQQALREFKADQIFVVIDHLQIFPCDKKGLDDMKSRLDYLVAEFKAITEQYNATILLVSEKNRQSYGREDLSAYMGSAGIEYGVDLAMLLFEDSEAQSGPVLDGDRTIHLKIGKDRFGNKLDMPLKFYPEFSAFEEL